MAEAPNITHLFIIFQAIIMFHLVRWALNSPIFHPSTIRPPSLRQTIGLQRRFHPKSQYHYHWFKQCMKRKKQKRFRKPKPLFHLTWKYKAVTLTLCALVAAYKVGCRVERFVSSSLSGGFCWVLSLFSKASTRSISCDPTPQQGYLKARFVAFQSLLFQNASKARFDTDSFKIGIDTLCSITMSSNRNCFKNLKPLNGPTVGGIAGGLQIQGVGTFCFKLEDSKGKVHTIKLFNSMYVPELPTTLLCPQHWSQQDNDAGTYIKNDKDGCWLV
jgi:hypothetical protein